MSSSISVSEFFAHSQTNDLNLVGSPPSSGNFSGKKVKKFNLNNNVNKENVNTLNTSKQAVCSAADRKIIETALNVKQVTSKPIQTLGKITSSELVDAVALEIAEVRKAGKQAAVGGLKQAGIKKWKFVVKMNDNDKEAIEKLSVGQYKAAGSFTKVYLTLDNKEAILVPMKKASSEEQIELAYEYISRFHAKYERMEDFAKETDDAFAYFNYSKRELMDRLPAKPQKIQVGSRTILVAPQATCLADKFKRAPSSQQDAVDRLEALRNVVLGIALMHRAGFVHGDLKPENMLLNAQGIAQPHDVGGGYFFFKSDSKQKSSDKLRCLVRTPIYTHYSDYEKFTQTSMADGAVFHHLGCAGDVFALGVSAIEVLAGMESFKGKALYPFAAENYCIVDRKRFVVNTNFPREFYCIEEISPEADYYLKQTLSSALHSNYAKRLSALEFAENLHYIIGLLKKV